MNRRGGRRKEKKEGGEIIIVQEVNIRPFSKSFFRLSFCLFVCLS